MLFAQFTVYAKSSAIAFTDTNSFGFVWPKKMKDKDTLLFNNIISQNPILGKKSLVLACCIKYFKV